MEEGYISDVPTRYSQSPSEISQDLVMSTKALEKNFKDRYRVLRTAYESRLKQLSITVSEACSKAINDEIFQGLKADSTSVQFLPAHLNEILERYLSSDREALLDQLVKKVSALEFESKKSKDKESALVAQLASMEDAVLRGRKAESDIAPLESRMKALEKEFIELSEQSETEIKSLQIRCRELEVSKRELESQLESTLECLKTTMKEREALQLETRTRNKELRTLETSFEQTTRDLHVLEDNERKERKELESLQFQNKVLLEEKFDLISRNKEMELKLLKANEEISRLDVMIQQKVKDEDSTKQHIAQLMKRTEMLLNEESKESNETLAIMHDKLKRMKTKLTSEIAKEKRLNANLKEEVFNIRVIRDDQNRQMNILKSENEDLSDQLRRESDKYHSLQVQLQSQKHENLELKSEISRLEMVESRMNEKLKEHLKMKDAEMVLLREKVRLETERSMEVEKNYLERKKETFKMHYENDFISQRNSDLTKSNEALYQENSWIVDSMANNMESQQRVMDFIERSVQQEKLRMQKEYDSDVQTMKQELQNRYESVLQEAHDNIDRLKALVIEGRSSMKAQSETITALRHSLKAMGGVEGPSSHVTNVVGSIGNGSGKDGDRVVRSGKELNAWKTLSRDGMAVNDSMDYDSNNTFVNGNSNDMGTGNMNNSTIHITNSRKSHRYSLSSVEEESQTDPPSVSQGIPSDRGNQLSLALQEVTSLRNENLSLRDEVKDLQDALAKEQAANMSSIEAMTERFNRLIQHHERVKSSMSFSRDESDTSPMETHKSESMHERQQKIRNTSDDALVGKGHHAFEGFHESVDYEKGLHEDDEDGNSGDSGSRGSNESDIDGSLDNLDPVITLEEMTRKEFLIKKLKMQNESLREGFQGMKSQLDEESNRAREAIDQSSRLQRLLLKVHDSYRSDMIQLKLQLSRLKSDCEYLPKFYEVEGLKLLQKFKPMTEKVISTIREKFERQNLEMKMELVKANSLEFTSMEREFLRKIETLNESHAKELQALESDVIGRAQGVVDTLHGDNISLELAHEENTNLNCILGGIFQVLLQFHVLEELEMNQIISLSVSSSTSSMYSSKNDRLVSMETEVKKILSHAMEAHDQSLLQRVSHSHGHNHDHSTEDFHGSNIYQNGSGHEHEHGIGHDSVYNTHDVQHHGVYPHDNRVTMVSGGLAAVSGMVTGSHLDNSSVMSNLSNGSSNHDYNNMNTRNVSQTKALESHPSYHGYGNNSVGHDSLMNQHNQDLLKSLSMMESESRAQSLQEELEELKSIHALEVEKMNTEKSFFEAQMKKSFQEQIVAQKVVEMNRSIEMENKINEEKNMRLKLQQSIVDLEKNFKNTIERLERENLELLKEINGSSTL